MRIIAPTTLVLALALSACATQSDGFRDRLAQGCASEAQCRSLYIEAQRRHLKCSKNCQDELEDQKQAQALYEAAKADSKARAVTARQFQTAGHVSYGGEVDRLQKVGDKLTGTCGTDERLTQEALAGVTDERLLKLLKSEATRKRQTYWNGVERELRDAMNRPDLQKLENVDDASASIPKVQAAAKRLRCETDAHPHAAELETQAEGWVKRLETDVATEKVCRASTACMDRRAATAVCDALERKRSLHKEMARERANPSGTVNLTALNDLGRQIQNADDDIAAEKKEFTEKTKKPFNESLCAK